MAKTKTTKTKTTIAPAPAKIESRICFGIEYYLTEAEALLAHTAVRLRGDTYNGGFFHGMSCGRAPEFDHVGDEGVLFFAVTTR